MLLIDLVRVLVLVVGCGSICGTMPEPSAKTKAVEPVPAPPVSEADLQKIYAWVGLVHFIAEL